MLCFFLLYLFILIYLHNQRLLFQQIITELQLSLPFIFILYFISYSSRLKVSLSIYFRLSFHRHKILGFCLMTYLARIANIRAEHFQSGSFWFWLFAVSLFNGIIDVRHKILLLIFKIRSKTTVGSFQLFLVLHTNSTVITIIHSINKTCIFGFVALSFIMGMLMCLIDLEIVLDLRVWLCLTVLNFLANHRDSIYKGSL